MSVTKNRKPISNISPIITHNINLPSKKFQNRSVQTLTSTLNSKIRYGRCRCPLIQRSLDYIKLQEMAREIQEETSEDQLNDEKQNDEINENEETFTNDREEENEILVWTIDPSRHRRCTCTSGTGLSFQQVLNKFQMSTDIKSSGTKNLKELRTNLLPRKSTRIPLNSTISKQRTRNWVKTTISNNNVEVDEISSKEQKPKLQTVLKGLHDEFFTLNCKYQLLNKQLNGNNDKEQASPEMLKQLADMEKELNMKEEEVDMVMSLYRDLLILKSQVKKLKEQKRATVLVSETLSKSEFQILKQIQSR